MRERVFYLKKIVVFAGMIFLLSGLLGCNAIRGKSDTPKAPEGSFRFENNQMVLMLDQIPSLTPIGGSVQVKSSLRDSLLIVHSGPDEFHAFRDKCTHRSKELEYDHANKQIRCSSIGHSRFDMDGKAVKGPAQKQIDTYKTQVKGSELFIDISNLL